MDIWEFQKVNVEAIENGAIDECRSLNEKTKHEARKFKKISAKKTIEASVLTRHMELVYTIKKGIFMIKSRSGRFRLLYMNKSAKRV